MQIYRRGSSDIYWIRFRHAGKEHRETLKTKSLADARRKGAEVHRRVLAGERAGNKQEALSESCLDLLAEYRDQLTRRGRTERHIRETCASIARILADSGATTMSELDTPSLERAIGYLADRSARTQNMAIAAVRAFCRWVARTRPKINDPAAAIDKARAMPARAQRRALSIAELKRLTSEPLILPERRMLYAVAAASGLRRGELAAMEVRDVDFSGPAILIRLHAENTKNRRAGMQPIQLRADVGELWRESLADLAPDAKCFRSTPRMKTWRADLDRAGIEEITDEGRLDFHSLRVTFGTHLAAAGVPLSLAQKLMRHSTPALTSNYYTRWSPQSHEEAIDALADLQNGGHKNGHISGGDIGEARSSAG